MLYSGTDPESYITEYTLVYEDNISLKTFHSGAGECYLTTFHFDVQGCLAHKKLLPPRTLQ